jgi:hypothetical protein
MISLKISQKNNQRKISKPTFFARSHAEKGLFSSTFL